jgi:hypothetical protein
MVAMKKNYVLVDFENVRPETIAELDKELFKLMVFVGASQSKVTYEFVAAMQRLGAAPCRPRCGYPPGRTAPA